MNADEMPQALMAELSAPRRNNYFYGKRLDVAHFRMEQDYGKQQRWLLNRLTLGTGVVCGLDITRGPNGQVCISAGYAIDPLGRELVVPQATCIDPWAPPQTCCGDSGTVAAAATNVDRNARRVVTLYLCYRECVTDYMPTFVSDCEVKEQCAPGTIVETYSLKVVDGLPPQLGDPTWCPKLWPAATTAGTGTTPAAGPAPPAPAAPAAPAKAAKSAAKPAVVKAAAAAPDAAAPAPAAAPAAGEIPAYDFVADAFVAVTAVPRSERELLCTLFDKACGEPTETCVPIAALLLNEGQVAGLQTCLFRPRLYSNAKLLDLILCLMQRIEACCGSKAATTLRITAVSLLNINQATVVNMTNPSTVSQVGSSKGTAIIQVTFNEAVDQSTVLNYQPTTGNPALSTFSVVGGDYPKEIPPGVIRWISPTVAQFVLEKIFLPATYTVSLYGTADPVSGRKAILATDGTALDGEPSALPSGDGNPGGNFTFKFQVVAGE
jgi:hypothetical protein